MSTRTPDGSPRVGPAQTVPGVPDGPGPTSTRTPRRRPWAAAVAVAVLVAAGIIWWGLAAGPESEAQVQLEATSSSGPSPFTEPVGVDTANVTPPANAGGERPGDTGGLYAQDPAAPSCDVPTLISQLTVDSAKATAWAKPLGIPADGLGPFVSSLTSTTLRADTAVTEYGYRSGQFQPYPAVLQAGTAVLVNSFGEPTVKCYSGNPLGRPTSSNDTANYAGAPWNGFTAEQTVRVVPTAAPVTALAVVNPTTGTQTRTPVQPTPRPDPVTVPGPNPAPNPAPKPGPNPAPPTGGGGKLLLTGTHNYDGTITLSDGRIIKANGDVVPPRVTVTHPPGSTTLPDGAIRHPNGLVYNRDGTERRTLVVYNGLRDVAVYPDGTILPPSSGLSARWNYDGTVTVFVPGRGHAPNHLVQTYGQDGDRTEATSVPAGSVITADGSIKDPAGNVTNPNGTSRQTTTLPGGTVLDQNGGNTPPKATASDSNGRQVPLDQPGQSDPTASGRPAPLGERPVNRGTPQQKVLPNEPQQSRPPQDPPVDAGAQAGAQDPGADQSRPGDPQGDAEGGAQGEDGSGGAGGGGAGDSGAGDSGAASGDAVGSNVGGSAGGN